MATITKTIGTSGRDYSTVTLWEADLDDGGIYSASDDAVGEMYNDSTFSEKWTIDGGATIGLNSITLTVAESERHDGTAGTGVRFIQSASWKCQVTTTVPTHLSWFEMDGNSTVNNNTMLSHTRDGTINHLILHNHTTSWNSTVLSASGHNLDTTLSNCIVYDFVNSAPSGKSVVIVNQGVASGAGNITGANLTIHGCYSTGDSPTVAYTLSDNYATRTGQNILITDCDVCFGISSYSKATVNHNASSDATASGTGSLTNIVTADQYVSTVSGSEDLHLKLGSDCIGAGIDLGTTDDVQYDIDGYDRDTNAVTWDIGADQFVVSSSTYNETGSGGSTAGGAAVEFTIFVITTSGGAVVSGAGVDDLTSEIKPIEEALSRWITTETGVRVTPFIPQGDTRPAIVIRRQSDGDNFDLDGLADFDTPDFEFSIIADTYLTCATLADQVRELLTAYSGELFGNNVLLIRYLIEGDSWLPPSDGQSKPLYQIDQEYSVFVQNQS